MAEWVTAGFEYPYNWTYVIDNNTYVSMFIPEQQYDNQPFVELRICKEKHWIGEPFNVPMIHLADTLSKIEKGEYEVVTDDHGYSYVVSNTE